MERITAKEVTSMMQAVVQVYEQPEVEQLDEIVRNLRPGETIKQYDERKKKEAEAAAQNRDKIVPDRGAYDELTKAQQDGAAKRKEVEDQIYRDGGGDAKVKEFQDKGYTLGQARRATMNQGRTNQRNAKPSSQSTTSGMTPAEVKAAQDAANQARRDGKMSDIRGGGGNVTKPADTKPTDTKPATPQEKAYGSRSSSNKDQQAVNREYDRLRYSKDPKERAQAAGYGKAMASAGAAKKDFSGYKSAADLAKSNSNNSRTIPGVMSNKSASGSGPGGYQTPVSARPKTTAGAVARVGATPVTSAAKSVATTPVTAPATPAAKPKLSIADRLQQIRDMRARSQSRIAAQGGTPATPAANPTPKAAPPSTTGATTTPTAKPVAKVDKKQPLKNGDPMERMTGKGAASLLETYSKVYEEREPQAIDEGIMGALAKVGEVVAEEKTAADPGMKARMGKEAPKKGGYKLPERTPANAKNVEYYKDDADLFDIIKGHFIEEGLTEEEALAKMLDLTDEERTEIIEGSCGSKKKSKKKGGY